MRRWLFVLLFISGSVLAQAIPEKALEYLPTLEAQLLEYWPDAPKHSWFAAQIEQETCITLKHKKCWSPYAELKTDREYGFGLGQITITKSFDNFKEAKKLDSSLKDWEWENRYNAEFQIRTLVLMNKFTYGKLYWADNPTERAAFMFSAYNGGLGGVLTDRKICTVTEDCDPSKWFGNIEHTSRKAKVAANGYGKSFFQINREYVRNIMFVRYKKYEEFMEKVKCLIGSLKEKTL